MTTTLLIAEAGAGDMPALVEISRRMGDAHDARYFETCFEQRRRIFIARLGLAAPGYAQLSFSPLYLPFRRLGIPEIQDVCVVQEARRQGVGAALVRACEDAARAARKTEIGIGVGLTARFGPAQRLYVRLGYLPDGAGLCHDDAPVFPGELRPIDDLLSLKLVKTL